MTATFPPSPHTKDTMNRTTQHRTFAAAFIAVTAVALAACSGGTATDATPEPTTTAAPGGPDTGSTSAAFPVTIEHALGTITLDSQPERIVTLGSHEHEYLYALGVAPIAVPTSWQGYDNGTGPWAEADRLAAGAEPQTFDPGTPYDAELIASFEPDLIIATYPSHEVTPEEYELLSGIAPVLVRPATDPAGEPTVEWGVSLEDELAIIARAVGKSDEAQQITADIDAMFAKTREAHPEWEGKTSIVGFFYEGNAGVYSSNDTRNQFLANLGLDVTAIEGTEEAWLQLSAEQLDILSDLDSIVWQSATDHSAKESIEGLPLYDSLGVTQAGGNLWLLDPTLEGAFFANSPSSIAYAIDAFTPGLEAALDGDPATEVPVFADGN